MVKKNIIIFLISISIFFLDRLTKYYVLKLSELENISNIPITSFLNLNLIFNKGIAFGLFSMDEKFYYNIITLIIILITLIVLFMALKTSGFEKYSFSMIFGGSLGNIFDRLYYSAVIDFIDIHINNIHWFIFNFADIFISTGVLLLIAFELCKKKNMKKIIIILLFLSLLSACESAGFSMKKKDNSDEFLVEKKNPLVMPPNYEDLPKPDDFQFDKDNRKDDEFENIINSTQNVYKKEKAEKSSLKESMIEKIN